MGGASMYTFQREKGGPYREINEFFQLDNLYHHDALNGKGEIDLVTEAFFYLHQYHPEFRPDVPCWVWRGMWRLSDDQFQKFQQGKRFYWPSFVSTSQWREIAEEFCKQKPEEPGFPDAKSVLFHIELLKSYTCAIKLEVISQYPEEKEILLYPYHRFEVLGVERSASNRRIRKKRAFDGFCGRGVVKLRCLGTH